MAPITWRNVEGPDFGSASRILGQAQGSFNNMFSLLGQPIQQAEQIDSANWEAKKQYNTDQFLSRLNQLKTPEELAAAQTELQGLRSGFGAQIDMTKVRDAQAALPELLQRRVLTNQAYLDQKKAIDNRPIAAAIRQEMIAGRYKQAQEAAGIYETAGMLDPTTSAQLMDQARNRLIQDESIQRDKEMHKARLAEMAAERKLRATQAAAARGAGGAGPSLADATSLVKLLEAKNAPGMAAAEAAINTSPFTGEAITTLKSRQAIANRLKETGVYVGDWSANPENFVDKLLAYNNSIKNPKDRVISADGSSFLFARKDKDGKEVIARVPLTANLLINAINQDKGTITDPGIAGVLNKLRNMAADPSFAEAAASFYGAKDTQNTLRQESSDVAASIFNFAVNRAAERAASAKK